jgi:ABC-type sugar transport system ATPase subunit
VAVTVIAERSRSALHPTLSMVGITKRFDAVVALRDVAFDVLPGEVHALLGENGAGKSTLMNVASGTTAPDEGSIVFDGAAVENLTPALAQELGIAIVHQHPALLPDMTVAENFRVSVAEEHLRRRDPDTSRRCGHCSTTSTSAAISKTGSRRSALPVGTFSSWRRLSPSRRSC